MRRLWERTGLADIGAKVEAGERITPQEARRLYLSDDLAAIGAMANCVRERLNGRRTYYVVNRHINYSNICENRCRFCAFSRGEGDPDAYVMGLEEILERARDSVRDGVTELHIVGGLHPGLPLEYYTEMLSRLRDIAPSVHLQAFTAVEVAHLAKIGGLRVEETLRRLRDAGLGSLPGGGAEVFAPEVRQELCPQKMSGEEWLDVMRTAHRLGIRSNATMLYGHVETVDHLVEHLERLRRLQDETGGFMAFIPLAFHPGNTGLSDRRRAGAVWDLKHLAVGRIFLDNFPHVKAFWIMIGLPMTQVSLWFGVDDVDGTVAEERITHAAGAQTPQAVSAGELRRLITEAGREPVERDTLYRVVVRAGRLVTAGV